MIYIIWFSLFFLFILSYLLKIPTWTPIILYVLVIIFRIKEKIGNYKDYQKISKRDENIELEKIAEEMAQKGLAFSSSRNEAEIKIKEDFQYDRKKQKRKFENNLINSLFLK